MTTARKLEVAVSPIPEGYHTVTTCITVSGADAAIAFYKKAFGAELLDRMNGPDGKTVVHASLRIGDSIIFLSDEYPGFEARSPKTLGASSSSIYLYVKDSDAAFRRAVEAGGVAKHEPGNMFWGDRCGTIVDPFGFHWDLATHIEDVPPDEMRKRGEKFMKEMTPGAEK
jgi:PhnB protein